MRHIDFLVQIWTTKRNAEHFMGDLTLIQQT